MQALRAANGMRFASVDIRIPLGLLAAALATLLLAPGFTDPAEGATPCSRYGDTRPKNLTQKHARNAVICLINRRRNANGRGDLHRNERIQEAARKHANRMARSSCSSHQCGGERTLYWRLRAANYFTGGESRWAYGENVGHGLKFRGTPRNMVEAWMNSSSHRSVILSRTFEDIGAGFSHRGARAYYAADFGLRRR